MRMPFLLEKEVNYLEVILGDILMKLIGGFIYFEIMYKAIGAVAMFLFSASLDFAQLVLSKDFMINFNFFDLSSTVGDASGFEVPNFFEQLINILTGVQTQNVSTDNFIIMVSKTALLPLQNALNNISGVIFGLAIVFMLIESVFIPTTGKESNITPIKVFARIVIFSFLLFNWQGIAGLYFSLFNEIAGEIGELTYNKMMSVNGLNLSDGLKMALERWPIRDLIMEVTSGSSIGAVSIYVIYSLTMASTGITLVQSVISYIQRYTTLLIYTFIGTPVVAISSYHKSSQTLLEYVKGMLAQTLGIVISMYLLSIGMSCIIHAINTTQATDLFGAIGDAAGSTINLLTLGNVSFQTNSNLTQAVFSLVVAIIFLSLSANSEKYLNMVGFRTMPNSDSARSILAGAGTLAMGVRMAAGPIAGAAKATFDAWSSNRSDSLNMAALGGEGTMLNSELDSEGGLGNKKTASILSDVQKSRNELEDAQDEVSQAKQQYDAARVKLDDYENAEKTFTEKEDNINRQFAEREKALDEQHARDMKDIERKYDEEYEQHLNHIPEDADQSLPDEEVPFENSKYANLAEMKHDVYGRQQQEEDVLNKSYEDDKDKLRVEKNRMLNDIEKERDFKQENIGQARVEHDLAQQKYTDAVHKQMKAQENLDSVKQRYSEEVGANTGTTAKDMFSKTTDKYGKASPYNPTDAQTVLGTDKQGNTYAVNQFEYKDKYGNSKIVSVQTPVNGAPNARPGTKIYNSEGEVIGVTGKDYINVKDSYGQTVRANFVNETESKPSNTRHVSLGEYLKDKEKFDNKASAEDYETDNN